MIRVFRPIPVQRLRLLVFDLDGTLIDSAQDLCNSVNATLREFNLVHLPDPAIAGFVGNGAPMLMRRSLAMAANIANGDVNEDLFSRAYAFFLQYYRSTSWTSPMPTREFSTRSRLSTSCTTPPTARREPWPSSPTSRCAPRAAFARG